MSDYKWLLDNLVCMANLAEFRGQPEASDILLKLHQEIALMLRGVLDRERGMHGSNVVPIGSKQIDIITDEAG